MNTCMCSKNISLLLWKLINKIINQSYDVRINDLTVSYSKDTFEESVPSNKWLIKELNLCNNNRSEKPEYWSVNKIRKTKKYFFRFIYLYQTVKNLKYKAK